MLAYSSIAHAGYVLVALTARSQTGTAAAMFYLAAYALMNIGAFAVVVHLAGKGERFVNVEDFAGLGTRQPVTAALLTIFLLSLIGVPLTGGFFGKFYIFKAALRIAPGVADGARPAEQRGGGVLLPAHPGGDVHARAERSGEAGGAAAGRPGRGAALACRSARCCWASFPSALLDFAGKSAVLLH